MTGVVPIDPASPVTATCLTAKRIGSLKIVVSLHADVTPTTSHLRLTRALACVLEQHQGI